MQYTSFVFNYRIAAALKVSPSSCTNLKRRTHPNWSIDVAIAELRINEYVKSTYALSWEFEAISDGGRGAAYDVAQKVESKSMFLPDLR